MVSEDLRRKMKFNLIKLFRGKKSEFDNGVFFSEIPELNLVSMNNFQFGVQNSILEPRTPNP